MKEVLYILQGKHQFITTPMTLKTYGLNMLSDNAIVLYLYMLQILIIWLYQFHILHLKNITELIQLYWKWLKKFEVKISRMLSSIAQGIFDA